jgi:CheY-like chemotaxis protein
MAQILVIDDDAGFRGIVRALLERAGHRVIEASDGRGALQRLRESPRTDLVITDLLMPQMDGIEVLQHVRRINGEIRILAMSGGGGLGPSDLLRAASHLGADQTITKPFRRDEFIDTVNRMLAA